MKICIIGSGYVGLVTGACFSYVGNNVQCIDIDEQKICDLNSGKIPIFEEKLEPWKNVYFFFLFYCLLPVIINNFMNAVFVKWNLKNMSGPKNAKFGV